MSEPLRIQAANVVFHIINRGNARQTVFKDVEDFEYYLQLLRRYKQKYEMHTYHYILMPNHVHLLTEPSRDGTLSKWMQGITLAYTKFFNKKYHSVGHVWQSRFHSIPIQEDTYFLRCARYIELNPVRARLADHPINYPWSSYHHHVAEKIDPLIEQHSTLHMIGHLQKHEEDYRQFIEAGIHDSRDHKNENFSEKRAYGDKFFLRSLGQN